jgi:hypothetical protein
MIIASQKEKSRRKGASVSADGKFHRGKSGRNPF